jgi:single-stranded-DNA-specific exonuclease
MLTRTLTIDIEMPVRYATRDLWQHIAGMEPFGFGNPQPVFASRSLHLREARKVGGDGKHLKLKLGDSLGNGYDAIAFGLGDRYGEVTRSKTVDIAYVLDLNEWNGSDSLQLKIRDITTGDAGG